jgi:hypothetical protein
MVSTIRTVFFYTKCDKLCLATQRLVSTLCSHLVCMESATYIEDEGPLYSLLHMQYYINLITLNLNIRVVIVTTK